VLILLKREHVDTIRRGIDPMGDIISASIAEIAQLE